MHNNRGADLFSQSLRRKTNVFSHFYDPVKVSEIKHRLKKESKDVIIETFGGFEEAERSIISFSHIFAEKIKETDYPISVLEISFDSRFSKKLTHRDFLGSLLGLGMDRAFIGDIFAREDRAEVYLHTNMAGFVHDQLYQVGNVKVQTDLLDLASSTPPIFNTEEKTVTISSLRLDAMVSEGFSMSRSKAAALIEGKKVFINWKPETNKAKEVHMLDYITLRGVGRLQVMKLEGRSKKNRMFITLQISV